MTEWEKEFGWVFHEPTLSRREEITLVAAWHCKGDMVARERVIRAYARWVLKLAVGFHREHPHCPVADFFNDGIIAAQKVLDTKGKSRFDPQRSRFSTFAKRSVRAALGVCAYEYATTPRPSHSTLYQLRKRASRKDITTHAEQKSKREAAAALLLLKQQHTSLDAAAPHFLDRLWHAGIYASGKEEAAIADLVDTPHLHHLVEEAVSGLSQREQTVLRRHFLEGETLRSLAKKFKLSGERIRQIKECALERVRKRIKSQHPTLWGVHAS